MNIYVNCIATAVHSIISGWPSAANSNWHVTLENRYNTDPNLVPWVGIYTPLVTVDPARSNIVSPFMATLEIPIHLQTMNYGNIPQAVAHLNDLSGEVYTAVSCYRTLLSTVNIIKGVTIFPFNRVVEDADVFVGNQITIIAEVFA